MSEQINKVRVEQRKSDARRKQLTNPEKSVTRTNANQAEKNMKRLE